MFKYINKKKESLKQERDQKNQVIEQLLTRVKNEYEKELSELRSQSQSMIQEGERSRSISPINLSAMLKEEQRQDSMQNLMMKKGASN